MEASLNQNLSQVLLVGSLVLSGLVGACAPLTDGSLNGSNGGCAIGNLVDNEGSQVGLGKIGALIGGVSTNTAQLGQPFVTTVSQTISSLDLKLDQVFPGGSSLSGTMILTIDQDSTATPNLPVPSTPNGTTFTDPVTHNPATAAVAITTTSIPLSLAPDWVTFSFGGPVTLGSGQVYWIVLTPSYGASATNYVEWRGSSSTRILTQLASYFTTVGSLWTPLGGSRSLDFRIGC